MTNLRRSTSAALRKRIDPRNTMDAYKPTALPGSGRGRVALSSLTLMRRCGRVAQFYSPPDARRLGRSDRSDGCSVSGGWELQPVRNEFCCPPQNLKSTGSESARVGDRLHGRITMTIPLVSSFVSHPR